jgi:hypothetical protein
MYDVAGDAVDLFLATQAYNLRHDELCPSFTNIFKYKNHLPNGVSQITDLKY